MAVSIGDLLADAHDHLQTASTTAIRADAAAGAAAGMGPIGRALEFLHRARPYPDWVLDPRPFEVIDLTAACVEAVRVWPDQHGRIPDLLGAASDAICTHARQYSDAQCQALTAALAETARRCAYTARRFGPYSRVPQLLHASAAATAMERYTTRPDVGVADWTVLDQLILGTGSASSWADRVVDAAVGLHEAVERCGPTPGLCMAEVILTINAAQLAAGHAAALLPDARVPATAAPMAWRAARVECRAFDDGTKQKPPDRSEVAAAAARLGRTLHERFGPVHGAENPVRLAGSAGTTADRSALYAIVVLLPNIATGLSRVARVWAGRQQVWAPERQLLSYEDRNYAVTSTDKNAPAELRDLGALRSSLDLAATLTTALAGDLRRESSRTRHSATWQPRRAGAFGSRINQELSVTAQSAHDALRRAQTLHPQETILHAARQQPRPRRR